MKKAILLVAGFAVLIGVPLFVFITSSIRERPLSYSEQKEEEAREKLPFISLVERVPKGKPISPTKALNEDARKRGEEFDSHLAALQSRRADLLKGLHERTRKFFVGSAGFGAERSPKVTPAMQLMDDFYYAETPDRLGPMATFPLSPGEMARNIEPNDEHWLHHRSSVEEFVYPRSFGYFKDLSLIAGFKPHGFRHQAPNWQNTKWRVEHIQLVGILEHEHPIVYLTDKMPSMEQIRQGKTRPIDFFEEAGMPRLIEGEDLVIATNDEAIRMLGSLRAGKTCQQCHEAQVGDLLGAFSYTLRPIPAKEIGDR